MEQLTLEQAAEKYGELNGTFGTTQPLSSAFEAGAEWQKEQLKTHMQEVIDTLENDFAKQLVMNVTNILFQ